MRKLLQDWRKHIYATCNAKKTLCGGGGPNGGVTIIIAGACQFSVVRAGLRTISFISMPRRCSKPQRTSTSARWLVLECAPSNSAARAHSTPARRMEADKTGATEALRGGRKSAMGSSAARQRWRERPPASSVAARRRHLAAALARARAPGAQQRVPTRRRPS